MYIILIGCVIILVICSCIVLKLYTEPFKGESSHNDGSTYRLLVSAQCRPYQDWQSLGVWWSAQQNWPDAQYTRLLSCTDDKRKTYRYEQLIPSYYTSDWAIHPISKDSYAPYNRPIAIKEYLQQERPSEEYMVIVDPDVIIRKPLNDLPVERGKPVAQRYDYLYNNDALAKLGKKFIGTDRGLQPLGMPIIIHQDDLRQLAPLWLELTEKIRDDPETKELSGWIAEMHSYCLAAAKLGLDHTLRNDLADRTPYNRVRDPYILHYDLEHECEGFKWNKRDYLHDDLIVKAQKMPIPENPPNPRFAEVFNSLNEAIGNLNNSL